MSELQASLLNRLRVLMGMGRSLDAAVEELIESIASDGKECAAALRELGPFALKDLERRTLRSGSVGGQTAHVTRRTLTTDTSNPNEPGDQTAFGNHDLGVVGAHPVEASDHLAFVPQDSYVAGAREPGPEASTDISPTETLPSGPVSRVSSDPAIPVDNNGKRKPFLLWTARDITVRLDIMRAVRRKFDQNIRDFDKLRGMLKADQTVESVWHRLEPETRKRLAAYGGIKRLAA